MRESMCMCVFLHALHVHAHAIHARIHGCMTRAAVAAQVMRHAPHGPQLALVRRLARHDLPACARVRSRVLLQGQCAKRPPAFPAGARRHVSACAHMQLRAVPTQTCARTYAHTHTHTTARRRASRRRPCRSRGRRPASARAVRVRCARGCWDEYGTSLLSPSRLGDPHRVTSRTNNSHPPLEPRSRTCPPC